MPTEQAVDHLRLVGVSGTNKVMAGELSRLASRSSVQGKLASPRKEGLGALVYPFDPQLAVLAVRYHRTSIRVLWDLYESRATRLDPLYEDLLAQVKQDPRGWHAPGLGVSVDARRMEAFAAGERQIVGTVKNAILDGVAARGVKLHVDPEKPDLLFDVRLRDGVLSVSVDLAGRAMHMRGYRKKGGTATAQGEPGGRARDAEPGTTPRPNRSSTRCAAVERSRSRRQRWGLANQCGCLLVPPHANGCPSFSHHASSEPCRCSQTHAPWSLLVSWTKLQPLRVGTMSNELACSTTCSAPKETSVIWTPRASLPDAENRG